MKYHIKKDQWSPRFLGQGVLEIFAFDCRSQLPNVSTSCGSTGCMGVGLIYRSKQMIEINRYSTPVQIIHELTYFKNVYIIILRRFKFYTMVRLSTCKSYRSLLLILCCVKHSVGSKLFFPLHPRHQLHIGDDYKLNCSKLISVHYYLGNIYFKVMYVVCPGKMLVDIHPKILGASCVFYFIVIDFYIKITRLA